MKQALITGAADGIGCALAEEALKAGYAVIGVDVDATRAQAARARLGDKITFIIADLADPDDVERVATEASAAAPLDLVVHNAGINEVGYFEWSNPQRQQRVIDVNLLAPMVLTRHLLAAGSLRGDATVVFISSLSRYVSYPGASVYAATKDGLAAYARSLDATYKQLQVLTVYPGPTRTAHARRYSPDNSREARRMPPEDLAQRIMKAVDKGQRVLIPGAANVAFAVFGRLLPGLANRVMRTSLLEKFRRGG